MSLPGSSAAPGLSTDNGIVHRGLGANTTQTDALTKTTLVESEPLSLDLTRASRNNQRGQEEELPRQDLNLN